MDDKKSISENKEISNSDVDIIRDEKGLSLTWKGMVLRGDFTELIPRIKRGRLESELIVKASGILKSGAFDDAESRNGAPNASPDSSATLPLAIDATAGLGEDSLLLAAAGFRVIMYEKDEIIYSLLSDAVKRALSLPDDDEYALLKAAVSRMEIHNEDSVVAMKASPRPDVVFLDPMFPERRKSSLVGKKLQILQQLENPCDNEEELLDATINLKPRRIIIKRPPKGPYLGGIKPTFSLSGKSVRIDCLTF